MLSRTFLANLLLPMLYGLLLKSLFTCLKLFLINLRLASGDFKTYPLNLPLEIADLPLCQDLLTKIVLKTIQRNFRLGNKLFNNVFNLYFLIANQPQKLLNQECRHAIIIITKLLIIFRFEKICTIRRNDVLSQM